MEKKPAIEICQRIRRFHRNFESDNREGINGLKLFPIFNYICRTMRRRLIFIALSAIVLSVSAAFTAHKFYVSITEVEYNSDDKRMEVSIKFIGHDLEKALKNAGVPELYLGTDKESAKANTYLHQYISKKFSIQNNTTPIEFTFVGKEVTNDDFIYCYLKSAPLPSIHSLTFNNSFLTELFDDQANILYYKNGSEKFDFRFTKQKTSIKKQ